ncbi:glycerol-3-phosphate 1-O-acyltransferase PlsY [Alistipes sp. OttesenSCG-928-L06]|nr:glycerol-3-phosphate 1-O-acyltransferase PlsY [Alistipes sp. OttesenSCG-928-L06]
MLLNIFLGLLAYLLGSIPSAVWISRKYYGIDIREYGSKNAGATNMLRVLGKRAALPVFAIDMAKGFVAVQLAHFSGNMQGSEGMFIIKIVLVGAAVLGHIFPLFAGFKGGKGVATLAGAVLGVYPPAVLLCLATFLLILLVTHYVSLSSMTAGVMFPIYTYFVFGEHSRVLLWFGVAVAVLLIFTHRKNIKRLLNGTESKIYIFKKRPYRPRRRNHNEE